MDDNAEKQDHVAERACGWLPGPGPETVAENGMCLCRLLQR